MNTRIDFLSDDELDIVVGGSGSSNVGDFTYCPPGSQKPEGLYAPGTDCDPGNPLITAFLNGFKAGGGTFPGGSPA